MIRIFNKKLKLEIKIDEKADWIQFNRRDYDEKPFVIIEFKEFNFPHHANSCNDCKGFINSFGQDTVDWCISYSDKVFRLDTSEIGKGDYPHNEIIVTMSDYNPGTKMTLVFNKLPTDKDELKIHLKNAELIEDYKQCCIISDLINE